MARRPRQPIVTTPEADAALASITRLAHELAIGLAGGQPQGTAPEGAAACLAMAMMTFLAHVDTADYAAVFIDGPLKDAARKPMDPSRYNGMLAPYFG